MTKKLKELYKLYESDLLPTRFLNFGKFYQLKVKADKLFKVKQNSYLGSIEEELTDQDLISYEEDFTINYSEGMKYAS